MVRRSASRIWPAFSTRIATLLGPLRTVPAAPCAHSTTRRTGPVRRGGVAAALSRETARMSAVAYVNGHIARQDALIPVFDHGFL